MPSTKCVKAVFDGQVYWLLWLWETLTNPVPPLSTAVRYASGPYESPEKAEADIPDDWTPKPFYRKET